MHIELAIEGMHCQACARRLREAFERLPGVLSTRITLKPPQAHIEADREVAIADLRAAAASAGEYTVKQQSAPAADSVAAPSASDAADPVPSLFPLSLIVAYLVGAILVVAWARGQWDWHAMMLDFMAGFFLVFSFFKLLDLRGFADAYQTYDILAARSRGYAFAYPFLELALGVAYLARWYPILVNAITLLLMLVSSIGVLKAVSNKRRIRCACLGTRLNLPMTTITLVEDLGMAAMAAMALLW